MANIQVAFDILEGNEKTYSECLTVFNEISQRFSVLFIIYRANESKKR